MPYPASSYPEGVDLTIIAGNQLHQVINGEANEVVSTTSGDIPSIRKALADSMMFKVPVEWVQGEVTTDPLETRLYNGQPYWAPEATLANPITLGTSPVATTDWLLAPQGYRNDYNLGKYQAGILISDSQEYVVYNGKSYFAVSPPYTTTSTTPNNDTNMFEGGYTTIKSSAEVFSNTNLLSNSNFLTPSPDAITHPNATPETYLAGTQIFSGVYAGDSDCTITLIDGRVNCTAGDYKFKLPNTGGLERVPVFTSSVSDYDGIPKTTGVSHALVGDEYVVTVTPTAGDVFSVKFEQGSVATGHDVEMEIGVVADGGSAYIPLSERFSYRLNTKDVAGVGDGVTNESSVVESVDFIEGGTYFVDEDTVIAGKSGLGKIKKTKGDYPANPFPNKLQLETLSEDAFTVINPRGWETDGTYAYCVTQGSYDVGQGDISTLEVFDISDKYNVSRLSSTPIGIGGDNVRALSLFGQFAYCQSFGGFLTIFDISNPSAPIKIVDRQLLESGGNREQSLIVGDLLITPLMFGGILFHSLSDPIRPVLIERFDNLGVHHKPMVDGSNVWIAVATPNPSAEPSLVCIDISNSRNPIVKSSNVIPTLNEIRTGSIQGRYLYIGGFNEANSRLHVIDISDSTNPSVVYVHPTAVGKECVAMGNLLFVDDELFDITNPEMPIATGVKNDVLHNQIQKPLLIGSTLFGITLGTGVQGTAPGDGYENPTLRAIRVSNVEIAGADISSLKSEEVNTRQLTVKEDVDCGSVTAGAAGISTTGTSSARRITSAGVVEFNHESARGSVKVDGDISSNTNLFALSGVNRHFSCKLSYTLISNASEATASKHTIGMKSFSFYVDASGSHTIRIPVGDAITERSIDTPSVLTVNITNGTASEPVLIGVSCPQLGAVGFPRSMFDLDVQCSDFMFKLEVLV